MITIDTSYGYIFVFEEAIPKEICERWIIDINENDSVRNVYDDYPHF